MVGASLYRIDGDASAGYVRRTHSSARSVVLIGPGFGVDQITSSAPIYLVQGVRKETLSKDELILRPRGRPIVLRTDEPAEIVQHGAWDTVPAAHEAIAPPVTFHSPAIASYLREGSPHGARRATVDVSGTDRCGTANADHPLVQRTLRVLSETLFENLDLTGLADRLSASRFHLVHVLQREIGLPPMRLRSLMRLGRGAELLLEGHTVTDVAAMLEFHDSSHFSHRFYAVMGIRPRDFVES